jgi:TorA maturation chaperone TorD
MSDPLSTKIQSEEEILLARSLLYQVLAVISRHPSRNLDKVSLKKEIPRWLTAVKMFDDMSNKPLESSLRLLLEEVERISPREWARQYEGCFGHTAQGIVPGYELEYGERQSLREPYQLSDISAFYHAFGLRMNDNIHERVDHVSVECEFMHFLLYKQVYALQRDGAEKADICRQASCRFLCEHLGRWVPSYALRLSKYAKGKLMRHLARFAFAFIVEDCRRLGITPGPEDLPLRGLMENEDAGCGDCCSLNSGSACEK